MIDEQHCSQLSLIFLGMGLVFYGLDVISRSMTPLKSNAVFLDLITAFSERQLTGIFAALIFTCIIQVHLHIICGMIYLVSFFSEQQCGHWNSYCSGTTACA
jgi:Na+/phosphate symporter